MPSSQYNVGADLSLLKTVQSTCVSRRRIIFYTVCDRLAFNMPVAFKEIPYAVWANTCTPPDPRTFRAHFQSCTCNIFMSWVAAVAHLGVKLLTLVQLIRVLTSCQLVNHIAPTCLSPLLLASKEGISWHSYMNCPSQVVGGPLLVWPIPP